MSRGQGVKGKGQEAGGEGPSAGQRMTLYAPLFTFCAGLLVYVLTLAPDLTWAHNGADGGDLIAASFTGGVAHPPGYPVYLVLGRLVALLPVGSVAYRYNLFSALTAAGAAAMTAWTAARLAWLEANGRWTGRAAVGGVGAGLSLAFAPLVWEQATIAEVYALNALFGAAILALSASSPRRLAHGLALSLIFSLASLHHLTLACFFPLVAARLAQMARTIGWRPAAQVTLAGAALGLAPLAYLPLAARGPVVWGDPSTPSGLWELISGALYRGYAFGLPAAQAMPRVAVMARTLADSFTLLGVAVGTIGLLALHGRDAVLAWTTALAALGSAVFAIGYFTADSQVYAIPALVIAAAWMGAGWGQVLAQIRPAVLAALLVALPPALVLARSWQSIDLHADRAARDFVEGVAAQAPRRALVITAEDRHTFALWVSVFVERPRPDIIVVDQDMLKFGWYRAALRRNFPDLRGPESGDIDELIRRNADRPACRPADRPPPWLTCQAVGSQ